MRKFLLIGSASNIVDWYNKNGLKAMAEGFILCAINNAWAIDWRNLRIWLRSSDFYRLQNTLKPLDVQRNLWYEIVHFVDHPFWYKSQGSGTMILNSLCHLINLAHNADQKSTIYIAGNNLIYRGGAEKDHFYHNGTADPLRLGEDYIKMQLASINGIAESNGHKIYNVDWQEGTLLPFERKDL